VPEASPIDPHFFTGDYPGGIIMNTALARRLALGDRVIWMGKDDYQPSGPGTIIRITAHQVEVVWEGETAKRYRRAQLHNLRHEKLAAERPCKPYTASKALATSEFAWHPGSQTTEVGP
jgi:hypothetical protein